MAIDGAGTVFDVRFYNIIVLGISFMLIFTAFQTASMAEVNKLLLQKKKMASKSIIEQWFHF